MSLSSQSPIRALRPKGTILVLHRDLIKMELALTYLTDDLLADMIGRMIPHRDNIVAELFLHRIWWARRWDARWCPINVRLSSDQMEIF